MCVCVCVCVCVVGVVVVVVVVVVLVVGLSLSCHSFLSWREREREGERGRDDYARRQCVAAATTTLNQQPNSLTTRIIRGHGLQRFFSALIMIIKILNCFGTCLLG